MSDRDPLGDIDSLVLRLAAAAMTLATVVGFVAKEWEPLVGQGPVVSGAIGTGATALIALAVRWLRR